MKSEENMATIATLLGAGPATIETVQALAARSAILVAVDGGAQHAADALCTPDSILGDFDSLPAATSTAFSDIPRLHLPDQARTDFDKALEATSADLFLCAGFLDGRLDHTLACLDTLLKWPQKRAILVSGKDVIVLMPPEITLDLPNSTRVSVMPLKTASAQSTGLRWPLDSLDLAPGAEISVSNEATGGDVTLRTAQPHLLLILPRDFLDPLVAAVLQSPGWSAH